MALKPLSEAELRQRREAARNRGRASKPASPKAKEQDRKARLARTLARQILNSASVESARALVAGMRGELPPGRAKSIVTASKAILAKVGIADLVKTQEIGKGRDVNLNFGTPASPLGAAYPEAKPAKDGEHAADDEGAEPPLAN